VTVFKFDEEGCAVYLCIDNGKVTYFCFKLILKGLVLAYSSYFFDARALLGLLKLFFLECEHFLKECKFKFESYLDFSLIIG